LSNPNGEKKTEENVAAEDDEKAPKKDLVEEDYQLYEALNILKSMNLVRIMNLKKG